MCHPWCCVLYWTHSCFCAFWQIRRHRLKCLGYFVLSSGGRTQVRKMRGVARGGQLAEVSKWVTRCLTTVLNVFTLIIFPCRPMFFLLPSQHVTCATYRVFTFDISAVWKPFFQPNKPNINISIIMYRRDRTDREIRKAKNWSAGISSLKMCKIDYLRRLTLVLGHWFPRTLVP